MTGVPIRPSAWPITIKAPLVVVALMVAVSAVVSYVVLVRLAATQESHLRTLADSYLDGLSSAVVPHVLREDVWEVFDSLDRARNLYHGVDVEITIVANAQGLIIAASEPASFPTNSELPGAIKSRFESTSGIVTDYEHRSAHIMRRLNYQGRLIGTIYAELNISKLLDERASVLTTLLVSNGVLTLMLAAIGFLTVRRIVIPVHLLDGYLNRSLTGSVAPIPYSELPPSNTEFGRLFRRYNAMVHAVNERQALANELAREEKMASLGRLASGMAHEINNPLGGMFNALDSLKRHGEQPKVRETSASLLERGLKGIRDVVRAALLTYRNGGESRLLRRRDFEDLKILIGPELKRKRLSLDWKNDLDGVVNIPNAPVRQAALNLLLNACAAAQENGCVSMNIRQDDCEVHLFVGDDGPGFADEHRTYLESEGAADVPMHDAAGLGLWMVRRLADEAEGRIRVGDNHGGGTIVEVMIPVKHEEASNVA